jgi:hypothetical protein
MNPVWAALITGFFGLTTAIITVFKDELRAWIAGKPQQTVVPVGPALLPIDSIVVKGDPDGRRKRPFDTKSEILRTEPGDAFVFRLHQGEKRWFELFFMLGWMAAWTAGIVFAAFAFFGLLIGDSHIEAGSLGMRLFTTVFLGGWLLAAIAGEFAVAKAIKRRLAGVLGRVQISVSNRALTVSMILGALMTSKEYETEKCDGFGETGGTVFFRYGIRRIEFDGMAPNEAEWLAQQLNNAYRVVTGQATVA